MEQTQKRMIINHLRGNGDITPKDALELFGCFRLAARIAELRKEGWDISTFLTRQGYALYRLNFDAQREEFYAEEYENEVANGEHEVEEKEDEVEEKEYDG
jgi:hypothetical protein